MAINLTKGETINLSKEAAGAAKFELKSWLGCNLWNFYGY